MVFLLFTRCLKGDLKWMGQTKLNTVENIKTSFKWRVLMTPCVNHSFSISFIIASDIKTPLIFVSREREGAGRIENLTFVFFLIWFFTSCPLLSKNSAVPAAKVQSVLFELDLGSKLHSLRSTLIAFYCTYFAENIVIRSDCKNNIQASIQALVNIWKLENRKWKYSVQKLLSF